MLQFCSSGLGSNTRAECGFTDMEGSRLDWTGAIGGVVKVGGLVLESLYERYKYFESISDRYNY